MGGNAEVQFRAEFFNLFNRVSLKQVRGDLALASVRQIGWHFRCSPDPVWIEGVLRCTSEGWFRFFSFSDQYPFAAADVECLSAPTGPRQVVCNQLTLVT